MFEERIAVNAQLEELGARPAGSTEQLKDLWETRNKAYVLSILSKEALWTLFNSYFQSLPLSIVTGNKLFLSHAGPSVQGRFNSVANGIRPWADPWHYISELAYSEDPKLIRDLTWSDLDTEVLRTEENLKRYEKGAAITPKNYTGVAFGKDALSDFLSMIDCNIMIRGHQRILPERGLYKDSVDVIGVHEDGATEEFECDFEVGEGEEASFCCWKYENSLTVNGAAYLKVSLEDDITSTDQIDFIPLD